MLTATDVAGRLQCSRSHAYALMRLMRHVVIGRRLVRVTSEEFERFVQSHEEDGAHAQLSARHAALRPKPPRVVPGEGGVRLVFPRTKPRKRGGQTW
jgi:hypothetical protein